MSGPSRLPNCFSTSTMPASAIPSASTDVNAHLHEISGEEITAKDFRTWAGTNLAALALREFEHIDSDVMRKRAIVRAVEGVAKHPWQHTRQFVADAISIRRFSKASCDGTLLATLAEKTRL